MPLRKPLALFALLCAPLACSHEMESRAPAPALADPQIVCNEQLTKSITLTGDGFSPTLFDALVDRQRLMLPEIFLTREKLLDGHAATGTRSIGHVPRAMCHGGRTCVGPPAKAISDA